MKTFEELKKSYGGILAMEQAIKTIKEDLDRDLQEWARSTCEIKKGHVVRRLGWELLVTSVSGTFWQGNPSYTATGFYLTKRRTVHQTRRQAWVRIEEVEIITRIDLGLTEVGHIADTELRRGRRPVY